MNKYIHLRKFKREELIFDKEETIIILKFIFKNRRAVIDRLEINDQVRGFAQGLLLEAVDASYALGFVHSLFGATLNPGAGAKKILIKFSKKALKHWFRHATARDLNDIKIYEVVRIALERGFTSKLIMYSNGTAGSEWIISGFVAYAGLEHTTAVWG